MNTLSASNLLHYETVGRQLVIEICWKVRATVAVATLFLTLFSSTPSALAQPAANEAAEEGASVASEGSGAVIPRLVILEEIRLKRGVLISEHRIVESDGRPIRAREIAAGVDDPALQAEVARRNQQARRTRSGLAGTGAAVVAVGGVLVIGAFITLYDCLYFCENESLPGTLAFFGGSIAAAGAPLLPLGLIIGHHRGKSAANIYNYASPERVEELVDEYNRRLENGDAPETRAPRRLPPAVEMGFRTDRGFSLQLRVRF